MDDINYLYGLFIYDIPQVFKNISKAKNDMVLDVNLYDYHPF